MKKRYTQEEVDKLLKEREEKIARDVAENDFRRNVWDECERIRQYVDKKCDSLWNNQVQLEERITKLEGKKKVSLQESV